jgi:hypothetical protein
MAGFIQNAENGSTLQFFRFCYCILFPKYAIMLLVKSKNNALMPPSSKKPGKIVQNFIFCLYFPAAKTVFCMGKCRKIRFRVKRRIRLRKAQRKVNSYEDDNVRKSSPSE